MAAKTKPKVDLDSYHKGVQDAWFAISCSLQCWGMGGDLKLGNSARQPMWEQFRKDFQAQIDCLMEEGPLTLTTPAKR